MIRPADLLCGLCFSVACCDEGLSPSEHSYNVGQFPGGGRTVDCDGVHGWWITY